MKIKKLVAAFCAVMLALACTGCNIGGTNSTDSTGGGTEAEVIPLTDEEKDLVGQMGEDVTVVTDAEWAEVVPEMLAHTDVYAGQAFQLEGVYHNADSVNGAEAVTLSRTLVNGSEKTVCALPLKERIDKGLPDGSWVRLTGFVQAAEYGGETLSELVVVAAETLAEAGNAELAWNGSSHNHT